MDSSDLNFPLANNPWTHITDGMEIFLQDTLIETAVQPENIYSPQRPGRGGRIG